MAAKVLGVVVYCNWTFEIGDELLPLIRGNFLQSLKVHGTASERPLLQPGIHIRGQVGGGGNGHPLAQEPAIYDVQVAISEELDRISKERNFPSLLLRIDVLEERRGEDVIIAGSVSNDEAKEIFGTWDEPKPYIRVVPQPQ